MKVKCRRTGTPNSLNPRTVPAVPLPSLDGRMFSTDQTYRTFVEMGLSKTPESLEFEWLKTRHEWTRTNANAYNGNRRDELPWVFLLGSGPPPSDPARLGGEFEKS